MSLNTKTPKISVIMSVYNEPEKYIKQSIESILNQTFEDFEFIVILDNPKNKVAENIIGRYSLEDKRIIFVKNKKNIGLTKSLNKGLSISNGKFIARMDTDDISHPKRFEKQISFLNNNEYNLCGTKVYFIDENGKIKKNLVSTINNNITKYEEIKRNIVKYNPFIHPSLMFKKQILNEIGTYDENFKLAQDYDFLLRVCSKYRCCILPEKLLYYRINQKGLSHSKMNKSLKYAIRAKHNAIFKYGYSKYNILYLMISRASYMIPPRIKQIILKYMVK
jgi:glycosyltransferase involved in cell wall biosynthesis